jgi:hypothetical protein
MDGQGSRYNPAIQGECMMLLYWLVRYADSLDRQFKDRALWLDTSKLDPVTRSAVELCIERDNVRPQRDILRYRSLFSEQPGSFAEEYSKRKKIDDHFSTIFVQDYFEDEHGDKLSWRRMSELLTGEPNTVMFPSNYRAHDCRLAISDKPQIDVESVSLEPGELRLLGYFARDLRELRSSVFMKEGSGIIGLTATSAAGLQTQVSDDEIRSFVTIFRRLYMENDDAGFLKAVELFVRKAQGSAIGDWVQDEVSEYRRRLDNPNEFATGAPGGKVSFSQKRLIDVFIYTQYAHQPNPKRERQFKACLDEVGGNLELLTWFFLDAMWDCSAHMCNAGGPIVKFLDEYCKCHQSAHDVIESIASTCPGLGKLEKKIERDQRLYNQQVKRLSERLWEAKGCPDGGPSQLEMEARAKLSIALDIDSDCE